MYLLAFFAIGSAALWFRQPLKNMFLRLSFGILKWVVVWMAKRNRLPPGIKLGKVHTLPSKVKVAEYTYTNDHQTHMLCIVSKTSRGINDQLSSFTKDPERVLSKKCAFLNCSITDHQGGYVLDITHVLRYFVMYFTAGALPGCILENVLEYLSILYPEFKSKCGDFRDYNLSIYMNDDCFTERVFPINSVYHTTVDTIVELQ
ncbi:MAG: hypothetical protein EBU90_11730 [Proteobacteria bacterium]|nr:hypothetical protein [Pseudomonadota bacterium]NBP14513.1 hypothetical protein [bacterium]